MNKKAIFIPLMLLAIQPNQILGAAGELISPALREIIDTTGQSSPKARNYFQAREAIEEYLEKKAQHQEGVWRKKNNITTTHKRGWISDFSDVQELLDRCRVEIGEDEYIYDTECMTIMHKYTMVYHPNTIISWGRLPGYRDQVFPNNIEIALPKDNPANLSTVKIDLTENETLTVQSFKELIAETGDRKFVIVFTQDANDKWHPAIFDGYAYETYSKTQGDQIKHPGNQQPIQSTIPITIKEVGDQYEYEID